MRLTDPKPSSFESELSHENDPPQENAQILEKISPPGNIRRAKLFDASPITRCVKAAYSGYIARMDRTPAPMLHNYLNKILTCQVFVKEQGQEVIGVLILLPQYRSMLLENVAVHPKAQGQGFGRQLLQLAELETRRQGFQSIELYTNVCMKENIELYRQLGYSETDRKLIQGYDRVFMTKYLP